MGDFSKHNEEEFLKSYGDFSVEARPLLIKILTDNYKKESNSDTKELLYLLSMEQFFMLYETFEGFFRAIKNRHEKPIFNSLTENLNIQNLYGSLRNKTAQDILREFNIQLNQFDKKSRKDIEERFTKMAGLWQREDFYKAMKELMPFFYKLKHKLLVYKKDGRACFVLEKSQEENIKPILQGLNIEVENNLPQNIDYLFDMAERLKAAILDLIAVRLLELQ